jgi:hypothetical protein
VPNLTVRNHTGYVTADLERFFKRGLEFFGAQKDKVIKVIPTKTDDGRGIAFVGRCAYPREKGACEGKSMVLMLPHPSQITMRRLARLFEHELKHNLGLSHEQMSEGEYWSRGPIPSWARGCIIQWHPPGRTPLVRLRSPQPVDREGQLLERELAKLPERSPTRRGPRR